jgi:hypothetical protein
MVGGVGDRARRPVEDCEIEVLLTGGGVVREELASLDHFLDEVRAPYPRFDPQPSIELARLFSEGPADALGAPPVAGTHDEGAAASWRSASTGRKPGRRLAKVAVATTTAALAVTLAAAAQVLPGTGSKTSLSVSGPATPVVLGADQSATVRPSDVLTVPGVTVQPRPTSPPSTTAPVRSATQVDHDALAPDALARLPLEILKTLSPENLARLPVEVLRTLPGDVLARLAPDVLWTLPADVLAKLPADALRAAPGDVLALLPLDLLRGLPGDVQSRLPTDTLRLVLVGPPANVAASTTVAVRP